ncbi:MAG: helix-turn-helix transcriptional regulator [Betaproteobacteria bacterium]|nr:helix-turn-helix transcriptional regulator [Betaproteobacteria bacterium]
MIETFGERLKRLREEKQVSVSSLAKHLGISRSAVSQLESGESKGMKPANLLSAAELLGVDPKTLLYGENVDRGAATAATSALAAVDVPIVGYALASPEHDGHFSDADFPVGHGDGYVPWPTRDKNAYALLVRGDSMQPRIRPGEIIVMEPNRQVQPGDDVMVSCHDGRKMVKQLLWRRGGGIALGSINQRHNQLTLSFDEVKAMHFVSAIVPRGISTIEPRDPDEGSW